MRRYVVVPIQASLVCPYCDDGERVGMLPAERSGDSQDGHRPEALR